MRNALITFATTIAGVLVALLAWHAWERREADMERAADERVREEAEQRGRSLEERVVAEQRAIEAIRSDVVAIAAAKVAITESYHTMGRMPLDNAAAGLPEPAAYRGRSLRSLSIGSGGRIVLEFDALSGKDGGVIDFVPDLAGIEAMGVQWRCTTRDYAWIARALPSCEYDAPPAASAVPATTETPRP
jgi:hypothetical protein